MITTGCDFGPAEQRWHSSQTEYSARAGHAAAERPLRVETRHAFGLPVTADWVLPNMVTRD
jgi:hypothetical protein